MELAKFGEKEKEGREFRHHFPFEGRRSAQLKLSTKEKKRGIGIKDQRGKVERRRPLRSPFITLPIIIIEYLDCPNISFFSLFLNHVQVTIIKKRERLVCPLRQSRTPAVEFRRFNSPSLFSLFCGRLKRKKVI